MTGKEIKELRYKLGMTQQQFARVVGVTISSVKRWENNKQSPSPLAEQAILSVINLRGIEA